MGVRPTTSGFWRGLPTAGRSRRRGADAGGRPLFAFSRDRFLELIARARQGNDDPGSLRIDPRNVAFPADRSSGAVNDRQAQAVPGHLPVRTAAVIRLERVLGALFINS